MILIRLSSLRFIVYVLLLIGVFINQSASFAAPLFSAKVVRIIDGDTLVVYDGHEQIKVRLAEIDAPEKVQPFGAKAKQALSDICFGTRARIEEMDRDRYGRVVAVVACNGVEANSLMVKSGMAWVYDRYATDKTLYALQSQARSARRGLWADGSPVPPWEWRSR